MEFIATVSNVLTIQVRKSRNIMTYRKGNLGKLRHAGEEIWESYGLQERNM